MARKKGKFIVLDGVDGSGKATQTKLLVAKLRKNKIQVKTIDFPLYDKNFFGKMIGECLVGRYGNFVTLDPRIASVLYAADRWESSEKIKKWIKQGFVVIADRYASSNQIHQGGKIKNLRRRQEFLEWLEKMEFEVFKISRPDAVIYLDVPAAITEKLLQGKKAIKKKKYSIGKNDATENNKKYIKNSRQSAIELISQNNNWVRINCVLDNKMMKRDEISEIIWKEVEKIIK
jgi:dTMP kinase